LTRERQDAPSERSRVTDDRQEAAGREETIGIRWCWADDDEVVGAKDAWMNVTEERAGDEAPAEGWDRMYLPGQIRGAIGPRRLHRGPDWAGPLHRTLASHPYQCTIGAPSLHHLVLGSLSGMGERQEACLGMMIGGHSGWCGAGFGGEQAGGCELRLEGCSSVQGVMVSVSSPPGNLAKGLFASVP